MAGGWRTLESVPRFLYLGGGMGTGMDRSISNGMYKTTNLAE